MGEKLVLATFVIGDPPSQPDFDRSRISLSRLATRPIYGPVNLNHKREIVGYIRRGATRADRVDPLERLSAMLEFADANMPKESE